MSVASIDRSTAARRGEELTAADRPVPKETVGAVVELLQHPDPTIRDDVGYATLRDAALAGKLDDHAQWLVDHFTGPEGMAYRESEHNGSMVGFVRSFAVLGLVLMVHRARVERSVIIDINEVVSAVRSLLAQDQDLTSWHPHYGWVHLVAHTADLVDELFAFPIEADVATELTGGLAGLVYRKSEGLFAFGEYERVAYAVATGLMRGVITPGVVAEAVNAGEITAREFSDLPDSVVAANHARALLRALYWQVRARDADPSLLEAVDRLNRTQS